MKNSKIVYLTLSGEMIHHGHINLIQKVKFFPPYSSYQSSSRNIEDVKIESSENKKIKKILNEKVKSVQRFCKGVIWLVTSDTLPSEENSW